MKYHFYCILPALALGASHAAVIDVSSPWGGTKEEGSFGQTFTPGLTGNLEYLKVLLIGSQSSQNVTVSVWDYDSQNHQLLSLLGSKDVPVGPGSYMSIDVAFDNPIFQVAGHTLAFTVKGGSMGAGLSSSGENLYAGGAYFQYSGATSISLENRDVEFQTRVTPVPEPHAPLIAAGGLLLLLFRRR